MITQQNVLSHYGYFLNGILPTLYLVGAPYYARRDFNDITSGSTGSSFNGAIGYSAGTGYDLATGLGSINGTTFFYDMTTVLEDINRDGYPDILFQNQVSGNGALVYYTLTGTVATSAITMTATSPLAATPDPTQWKAMGIPDINRDGVPDIIWQNQSSGAVGYYAIASENASQWIGISNAPGVRANLAPSPSTWQIVGTPDINGDGVPDIMWQNQVTGQITFYLMTAQGQVTSVVGLTVPANSTIASSPAPSQWRIVGSADFNREGNPDILFQNIDSSSSEYGDLVVYFMSGTEATSTALVAATPASDLLANPNPTQWSVVGLMDVNRDGYPDLLWQNQSTGLLYFYEMNGTVAYAGVQLTVPPGSTILTDPAPSQWHVVNH